MLDFNHFDEIEINQISPEGWLKKYLQVQCEGLTGHLDVTGYPFDTEGWGASIMHDPDVDIENWWPYEQVAYWIDALTRCGILLKDDYILEKALLQIEYVLKHQDKDGYLGPEILKESGKDHSWPHVVFFRGLIAFASLANDNRVVPALERHYLLRKYDYSNDREVCNVEIMLWVYQKTRNKKLLELAVETYEKFNRENTSFGMSIDYMQSDRKAREHGVSFNEIAKLACILFIYTGKKLYLNAAENAYLKIDRDHMLIDGVHSSSEFLDGKTATDAHETCDIADYTWALGYLLMATGNAEYADKIERACFNAAPGAVTSDFKSLQYFSSPNQVIADNSSWHGLYMRGSSWMAYRPAHEVKCCQANINRIMPNFVSRMWMKTKNNNLAATFYGPGKIETHVGKDNQKVIIVEEANYPFSEDIKFNVKTNKPVEFSLLLRIPKWCAKPEIIVNGKNIKASIQPGTFYSIQRVYRDGDCIVLRLPMEVELISCPENGVAIQRGPLVYSFPIEAVREKDDSKPQAKDENFPTWDLYPDVDWNYALELGETKSLKEIDVVIKSVNNNNPWLNESPPIEIYVPAIKIPWWQLVQKKKAMREIVVGLNQFAKKEISGNFTFTPQLPNFSRLKSEVCEKIERIRLVPYGCTNLRVTVFPYIIADSTTTEPFA